MSGLEPIGAVAFMAAILVSPVGLLRWFPQIVGKLAGHGARAGALIAGAGCLGFVAYSLVDAHRSVCAAGGSDREWNCEISEVILFAVFLWLIIAALLQSRFALSVVRSFMLRWQNQ